jgi:hypothetical protein
VLPLTAAHPIHVGDDEDAALRETMNDVLLDLLTTLTSSRRG